MAEKSGATGRLAGYLAAGRPVGVGQRQVCPASAAFVAEGNMLEGMTLAPSLKGAAMEQFLCFQRQECLPMAARQQSMRVALGIPGWRKRAFDTGRQPESLASASRATSRRPAAGG